MPDVTALAARLLELAKNKQAAGASSYTSHGLQGSVGRGSSLPPLQAPWERAKPSQAPSRAVPSQAPNRGYQSTVPETASYSWQKKPSGGQAELSAATAKFREAVKNAGGCYDPGSGNAATPVKGSAEWSWSKGQRDRSRTRRRSRSRRSRPRERQRARSRSRRKENSRRSRSRRKTVGRSPRRSSRALTERKDEVGGHTARGAESEQIEENTDKTRPKYRAKTAYPNANGASISCLGPWREQRSAADDDLNTMRVAWHAGGHQGLQDAKNMLYRGGSAPVRSAPRSPSVRRPVPNSPPDYPTHDLSRSIEPSSSQAPAQRGSSDSAAQEETSFKVEGPNERGLFRCQCQFKSDATNWRGEAAKPQNVVGSWRDSQELAEDDGTAMCDAFQEGGIAAARALKNQNFAPRPASSSVTAPAAAASAEGGTTETEREVESWQKGGERRYRASCSFERLGDELASGFGKNSVWQGMTGPWRSSNADAEADRVALHEAYQEGGTELANAKKNQLRKERMAEIPSDRHVVVPGAGLELSDEQLGETYGKGLDLMRKMGFDVSAGGGLGSDGEGLSIPLDVLSSNSRRAPYDKTALGFDSTLSAAGGRHGASTDWISAGVEGGNYSE